MLYFAMHTEQILTHQRTREKAQYNGSLLLWFRRSEVQIFPAVPVFGQKLPLVDKPWYTSGTYRRLQLPKTPKNSQ
jgi:hypothetical protein